MASLRVAILISGGGSNMVKLVDAMQNGTIKATPALVLANNANAGGLTKAAEMGVATAVLDHRPFAKDRGAFETALQSEIAKHNINIVCLAGFMRILTAQFIDNWTGKMLNIHPSLLPKYKGLHTHQRALDAGDTVGGCSVHIVTSELDGGPILGQTQVQILPEDTADDLAARVLIEEHKLYPKILSEFVAG